MGEVNPFVKLVTSREWRDQLASHLRREPLSPEEQKLYDPLTWLEDYAVRNEPVPAGMARAIYDRMREIAEARKPRAPWRPKQTEPSTEQHADDIACFLAVRTLEEEGVKPNAAGARVGELIHKSRQAVLDAYHRQSHRPMGGHVLDAIAKSTRALKK